jgi:phosphotransacetylase
MEKNMKRDYEKLLESGNKAQLEKLLLNEHKRGFENIDLNYASDRIEEELDELWVEIQMKNKDFSAIRKEAADIANFAHMIIYKCDQELKK